MTDGVVKGVTDGVVTVGVAGAEVWVGVLEGVGNKGDDWSTSASSSPLISSPLRLS